MCASLCDVGGGFLAQLDNMTHRFVTENHIETHWLYDKMLTPEGKYKCCFGFQSNFEVRDVHVYVCMYVCLMCVCKCCFGLVYVYVYVYVRVGVPQVVRVLVIQLNCEMRE